jgi:hypothetical protein
VADEEIQPLCEGREQSRHAEQIDYAPEIVEVHRQTEFSVQLPARGTLALKGLPGS